MKKVYDAVAVVGEYTDKSGATKKRYVTCGAVFQGDKGMSMKLESVPIGFNGWLSFYEAKGRDGTPAMPAAPQQKPKFDDDSDLPF